MTKSLSEEGELVSTGDGVDKNFICVGSECHEPSGGAHSNRHNFVWVGDLSDGFGLITVPE